MHARAFWLAAALVGCRGGDGGTGEASAFEGGDEGSGSSSTGGSDPEAMVDSCVLAPTIELGRTLGTLRNKTSDRGGACGTGGPDAYYRFEVGARVDVQVSATGVGFVPRVGVLPDDCVGDFAQVGLACTVGLPIWVGEIAPSTTLLFAVGADADEPALSIAPAPGMPDPLEFALDVQLRAVLDPGEPCEPQTLGRCVTGTACIAGEDGVSRCTALPGDSCVTAEDVAIAVGSLETRDVDLKVPWTDAHAHSCTGAHRRDKVFRVELPQPLPTDAALSARVTAPEVGLAMRGPGCDLTDELACAPPGPTGAVATVAGVAQAVAPGDAVYVFVELPPAIRAGEEALVVELELATP